MEKKRKWIIIAALLLFLCLGMVWLVGAFDDGQLAKVQAMQKQIEENKDLTWDQRREAFRNLRKEVDLLPKDQRAQFHPGRNFARRMQERLKHYFELPLDQRVAELDKMIQQMEEMRQRWQEHQADGSGRGGRNGDGSQASNGDSGAGQNDKGTDNNGNSDGKSDSNGNNWRNMDRQTRMHAMLDNTTAIQRAQMGEFRMDMNQRRAQLGLPPMQGPGGFGGMGMRPR